MLHVHYYKARQQSRQVDSAVVMRWSVTALALREQGDVQPADGGAMSVNGDGEMVGIGIKATAWDKCQEGGSDSLGPALGDTIRAEKV
ncbi:hypothetical protein LTR56_008635 [Elasticomyces elasticus]|nr:hypothetical protein LTR56_008635 [Elasticomyces elasticus]KAK3662241.1 hypothetical protein LTR22_007006 [Elasticomyces elasticus]KAK4916734.1 hypothetical protein LTR49_015302 [Elasticomyces elasticus]KAK5768004.1 hypothetical protein LTS12_001821 [Elasticomyces elasticus]